MFRCENKDCDLSLQPGSSLVIALQSPINLFFIFTLQLVFKFFFPISHRKWVLIKYGVFVLSKIFILPSGTKHARYFVMTCIIYLMSLAKFTLTKMRSQFYKYTLCYVSWCIFRCPWEKFSFPNAWSSDI